VPARGVMDWWDRGSLAQAPQFEEDQAPGSLLGPVPLAPPASKKRKPAPPDARACGRSVAGVSSGGIDGR